MRTEYSKRGVVSIFLVLALVFSMVTISAPMASAGGWPGNPHPGGDTIYTIAGADFLIRHWLEWNEVENGAYTITVGWYNYGNKPEENLTFVSASAYFITGSHIGESITADATLNSAPSGSDTAWALVVECPATNKDNRDGEFYVDITLGAYGTGGVPHIPGYHEIPWQLGGVIVIEKVPLSWNRDNIAISITGVGVTVDIDPGYDNGWMDEVLDYTVTVTNTGQVADNYTLVVSDNAGWTTSIVPSSFTNLGPSSSDTATLSVTVGDGTSLITVTADGVYADNSDTCIAEQLRGPNVSIDVEPEWQENLPGSELYYSVTVKNTGTVWDNYIVGPTDTEGWGPHFSTVQIYPTDDSEVLENLPDLNRGTYYNMYVGVDYRDTLSAIRSYLQFDLSGIPGSAIIDGATLNLNAQYGPSGAGYRADNDRVTVRPVDDDTWDESTITWNTKPAMGSPILTFDFINSTWIGSFHWYSLDVTARVASEFAGDKVVSLGLMSENEGRTGENYVLGWFHTKDNNTEARYAYRPYLEVDYHLPAPENGYNVELNPGESDTRTMTVPIPSDAVPCTTDEITVTATSQVDPSVDASDTVEAHAEAALEVDVTVEDPTWQEQHANKELNYWVTITNEGAAPDNYEVVLSDDAGWNPTWDVTVKLLGIEDTQVAEATPDTPDTRTDPPGKYYNMYNGWTPTYLAQRDYLKFDVSSIPTCSVIKSATLWATGRYGPSYPGYTDTWHLVDAMSVEDDSWSEETLTWNMADENHPMEDVLDTENFAGDLFVPQWTWLTWDVTDFVASEHKGNQLVSIGLKAQVEDNTIHPNGGSAGWFKTKDDPGYWMEYAYYLEITYAPGVTDTVQIELGVGESVTLGFNVIVPADAIPSNVDNITVTATSETDPTVSGSDIAYAHVELMRKVEAEVVGPTWQETYKDPLTYVIKIHNAGQIADKYVLTAYDTRKWPLLVEPQEIYLKPSHEAQAALSVTIPYQTPGSTTDYITVVIEGQLASGTFSDPTNVSTSVEVEAHAKEVKGVDVEVYPSIHQTGHPNSRLTWLVTVTNTGNMPDSYTLELSQKVYDANRSYGDWVGGLTQTTVQLDEYEEASILLNLDVPADLRTGVHNDITITAISQTQENIRDTASVTAQVLEQKPRIPQGEIQLQATAGIVAIDVWPTYYDFGVFNEMDIKATPADYFTIRNIGNVNVEVSIAGTDATSKPGEPAAKWTLGDGSVGVDMYAMWRTEGGEIVATVTKTAKVLASTLVPSEETKFDLKIQAPSTFTTPAKMWMKVLLTARKLH